jgi:nucleoside-diphosphate-sugar epimerase
MNAPRAWDANTRLRTDGVRLLLQAALKAGAKQYLQQSITMAYPDHGDEWITEGMPLDTAPDRATVCAPVIAMEDLVRTLATDRLRWCILRGGSFVGPGTFQENLLANLRNGQHVIAGTGQNFVSLIHVADMASAVLAALKYAPDRSIFNIAVEPLREGEYLDRLADAMSVPRPARDATKPNPPSWLQPGCGPNSVIACPPFRDCEASDTKGHTKLSTIIDRNTWTC